MDPSSQAITIASAPAAEVRLHPLVLMHVYNQSVRRKDTEKVTKVVGALLGYKTDQVSALLLWFLWLLAPFVRNHVFFLLLIVLLVMVCCGCVPAGNRGDRLFLIATS